MNDVLTHSMTQKGKVSPNPYVACFLLIGSTIVGKGVHRGAGSAHAELDALNNLPKCYDRSKIKLFVNLEPCCHFNKRTPPCAQLLIKEGIKFVVVGCLDPNKDVSGKGIKMLRDNDINVTDGVLEAKCADLNKIFFKNMNKGIPYFHGKIACSFDGKISLNNGASKWITSSQSRTRCHQERQLYDAILVGKTTFLLDKPSLNTRLGDQTIKENKKIIVGTASEILPFIPSTKRDKYIILCKRSNARQDIERIEDVLVIYFKSKLSETFNTLLKIGISSVYVEGGSVVFSDFLKNKLFDEISIFKAPKIIGRGKSYSDDLEFFDLNSIIDIKTPKYEILGEDILLKGNL